MALVDTLVSDTVLIDPRQVVSTNELPYYSFLEHTRCSSPPQVGLRWDASRYHYTYAGTHCRRTLYSKLARSERSLGEVYHLVPYLPASCAQHRHLSHTVVCVRSRHCQSRKVSCRRGSTSLHRILTCIFQSGHHLLQAIAMVTLR